MTGKRNDDTIDDPAQGAEVEGEGGVTTRELPPLPLADFSGEPDKRHDQTFDEAPEQVADAVAVTDADEDADDFPAVEVVVEGQAVVAEAEFVGARPVADDETPTVYGARIDVAALTSARATDPFSEDNPPEIIAPDSPAADDDAPDHEPGWWSMAESVVELIGEMEEDAEEFDHLRSDQAKTCRLVAERLTGILRRNGVGVIGPGDADEGGVGEPFDRSRHQPVGLDGSDDEAVVQEITRPGFVVGNRVLRRARVRLRAMA